MRKSFKRTLVGKRRAVDYRAYRLDRSGRIVGVDIFWARTDEEAERIARSLLSAHPIELRSGDRLLGRMALEAGGVCAAETPFVGAAESRCGVHAREVEH